MQKIQIPAGWKIHRSTQVFTKDNVPSALLSHHNTAEGVYGQICVLEGVVIYYGFNNEHADTPETEIVINAGQFALSPPQYWHRVELSDDARFNINFWSEPGRKASKFINTSEH